MHSVTMHRFLAVEQNQKQMARNRCIISCILKTKIPSIERYLNGNQIALTKDGLALMNVSIHALRKKCPNKVLLKMDFKNAYNEIDRKHALDQFMKCPAARALAPIWWGTMSPKADLHGISALSCVGAQPARNRRLLSGHSPGHHGTPKKVACHR